MTHTSFLSSQLAILSDEARASTIRRFRQIQPTDWNWSPRKGSLLTFADMLQHLVDADQWLLARLDGGPPSEGVVITPGVADPERAGELLELLLHLGAERSQRISMLSDHDFELGRFDLLKRGTVNLFQLISRCNLDHEAHHRGALQLALRLRYG
jgi:uncharacterized damage-inducible protein DinB